MFYGQFVKITIFGRLQGRVFKKNRHIRKKDEGGQKIEKKRDVFFECLHAYAVFKSYTLFSY